MLIIHWIPAFTILFKRILQPLDLRKYFKALQEVVGFRMVWKLELFLTHEAKEVWSLVTADSVHLLRDVKVSRCILYLIYLYLNN